MKKIISIIFLFLTVGIFLGYSSYTKTSFDYDFSQFIGYLFYWSLDIFLVSLVALSLNKKQYKLWSLFTTISALLSIVIAYKIGGGNSGIVSFDGKDATWFFAGLYSFASIIYFIVQYLKRNKTQ